MFPTPDSGESLNSEALPAKRQDLVLDASWHTKATARSARALCFGLRAPPAGRDTHRCGAGSKGVNRFGFGLTGTSQLVAES